MSGMQVSAVPPEHVMNVWSEARPHLEKAAVYTYGRYEVDDILTLLTDYGYQLWIAFDKDKTIKGAVVTGFNQYPRKKYLDLTFIGGEDALSWKEPMLKILQHWAYDTDCDGIESHGRAGWARVFKDDGYRFLWQNYELPVATSGLEG